MIFGQSGGDGKVNTLMAMPAAKGLFHKAAVEKGSLLNAAKPEDSPKLGAAALQQLGLSVSQVDQIQTVPVDRVIGAGRAGVASLATPFQPSRGFSLPRIGWLPAVDGTNLPAQPWDPAAPAMSADVPVLVGTVLQEFLTTLYDPKLASLTSDGLKARVKGIYGDKSERIPTPNRANCFAHLGGSGPAERYCSGGTQSRPGSCPCTQLLVCMAGTPVLDRRPGAFHCSEIAFVFDNTDPCAPMTGGGPAPRALAAKVSEAWINFARRGGPNHSGLPHWPSFTADQIPTMTFETECVMKNNPDGAERRILTET